MCTYEEKKVQEILTKIKCRNCGMIKETVSDIDIGSDDPPVIEHWDQISKCCQQPDYRWYDPKSELVDILDTQFGAELGRALGNKLPEIFKVLVYNLGSRKTEEFVNQIIEQSDKCSQKDELEDNR